MKETVYTQTVVIKETGGTVNSFEITPGDRKLYRSPNFQDTSREII